MIVLEVNVGKPYQKCRFMLLSFSSAFKLSIYKELPGKVNAFKLYAQVGGDKVTARALPY